MIKNKVDKIDRKKSKARSFGNLKSSGSKISKKIKAKEDQQLFVFFCIIVIVFAAFLIPYFYIEKSKFFKYAGAEWLIEDYDLFIAYHVRFPVLSGQTERFHNVWFRNDPREINVPVEGEFSSFKYGGLISFDEFTGSCLGEFSRAVLDLSGFVGLGIGTEKVEVATTDKFISLEEDRRYALCDNTLDRTLIILQKGDRRVFQDEKNPYCYTINVESCDDILGIEAFMLKTINDSLIAITALEALEEEI